MPGTNWSFEEPRSRRLLRPSGRLECRKTYPFGSDWNGKRYEMKTIRPIFAEEADEIVVVTAYVYYHQRGTDERR